jgi:hypothetical protein
MRRYAPLLTGIVLVGLGSIVAANSQLAESVVRGPAVVRAALTGVVAMAGIWLLALAVSRMSVDPEALNEQARGTRLFADMIRGIRLAFLAVAAFAAASAFVLGSVLPLVIALVIAGVDVAETALLLLVARMQRDDEAHR